MLYPQDLSMLLNVSAGFYITMECSIYEYNNIYLSVVLMIDF